MYRVGTTEQGGSTHHKSLPVYNTDDSGAHRYKQWQSDDQVTNEVTATFQADDAAAASHGLKKAAMEQHQTAKNSHNASNRATTMLLSW